MKVDVKGSEVIQNPGPYIVCDDYGTILKEVLLNQDAPLDDERLQELIESAENERTIVLEDVKARLGETRYSALRAVGGLGILARALECPD